MKLKALNSNSGYKAKVPSVIMFSLALMLLFFSCPLKKMLTNEATHSSAIRTNQTNQPVNNNYEQDIVLNSCSVKKSAQILKFTVSKEIKSTVPVPNHPFHSAGFFNPYFLSTTITHLVYASSVSYALPLFLRHSSLLI
jgi:hypothetical protein